MIPCHVPRLALLLLDRKEWSYLHGCECIYGLIPERVMVLQKPKLATESRTNCLPLESPRREAEASSPVRPFAGHRALPQRRKSNEGHLFRQNHTVCGSNCNTTPANEKNARTRKKKLRKIWKNRQDHPTAPHRTVQHRTARTSMSEWGKVQTARATNSNGYI